MWPRDLLPDDVRLSGLSGRFSTIGYKAQALSTFSASTTIQKSAEDLLMQISTHRRDVFACLRIPKAGRSADYLNRIVICQCTLRATA